MKDLVISMMLEHLEEKVNNPYAIGMAAAMKATGDEPPLKKSTITKAHKIAKGIEKTEEVDLDEAESYTHRVGGYYTHRGDDKPVSVKVNASSEKEAKEKASAQLSANHRNYRPTTVKQLTNEDLDEANQVKMSDLKVGDTIKLGKRFGGQQGIVHKVHKDGADIIYGSDSPTFAHHSNFTKINVAKEEVDLDEVKKVKSGHNAAVMAKNISKVLAAMKKEEVEQIDENEDWMNDRLSGKYKSREGGTAEVSKHSKKGYWQVKHSDGKNNDVPTQTRALKAYINRGYLVKEEVELDEAVNAKKIIADHDAGHSVDVIVQNHLNKKADNKDEILKVIRNNAWNKRLKK